MVKRYEHKFNEIQAVQYNGTNALEIVNFVGDVIGIDWYKNSSLEITMNNGYVQCYKGDYIVKDHNGKIEVYDVDEFGKKYSEVEDK